MQLAFTAGDLAGIGDFGYSALFQKDLRVTTKIQE